MEKKNKELEKELETIKNKVIVLEQIVEKYPNKMERIRKEF